MPGTTLDFDETLARGWTPPLDLPEAACSLIEAPTALTRITGGWAEWLLELRVLARDGRRSSASPVQSRGAGGRALTNRGLG
jgi:hypothetical protein